MIRLSIAGLMVLIVGGANAATNETIFQDCKKYVENGFETKKISDLSCVVYFSGVRDVLADICREYQHISNNLTGGEKAVFEFFGVGEDVSVNAAIQHYVNKMEKMPEDWKYNAAMEVRKSLQKIDVCRPE